MKSGVKISAVIHLSASAVYVVVARKSSCKTYANIMAIGMAKTDGFCRGQIIHRDGLIAAIKTAIKDAEEMANVRIETVTVCLSCPELISDNQVSAVRLHKKAITNDDMATALSNAKNQFLPANYYLAQFLPQMMWLDDSHHSVKSPVGIEGVNEMKVSYHLMALPVVLLNNIYSLLQSCNVMVHNVIFDMVAGAEYALMAEEREQGVLFVDIGAKSTNICLYSRNILLLSACIGVGGDDITEKIATSLSLTIKEAERLKRHCANLQAQANDKMNFIDITMNGNAGVIGQERLHQVVKDCYDILFAQIEDCLRDKKITSDFFRAGIVLFGEGSQIQGLIQYLKRYWQVPVHITNTNTVVALDSKVPTAHLASLTTLMGQRQLRTALGAMIYDLNDDFYHQQAIHEYSDEPETFWDKLTDKKDRLIDWLRRLA